MNDESGKSSQNRQRGLRGKIISTKKGVFFLNETRPHTLSLGPVISQAETCGVVVVGVVI